MNEQQEKGKLPNSEVGRMLTQLRKEFPLLKVTEIASSLKNAGNDLEKARNLLENEKKVVRTVSSSKREAKQGLLTIKIVGNQAVIFILRCENDFVSNTAEFASASQRVAEKLISNGGNLNSEVKAIIAEDQALINTRENIFIDSFSLITKNDQESFATYRHYNSMYSIVVYEGGNSEDASKDASKIAIQVCWSKPSYLSKEEIPGNVLIEKTETFRKNAWAENPDKSSLVIEKIVANKLAIWISEQCLLSAEYYECEELPEGKVNVEQFLSKRSLKIKKFSFLVI